MLVIFMEKNRPDDRTAECPQELGSYSGCLRSGHTKHQKEACAWEKVGSGVTKTYL